MNEEKYNELLTYYLDGEIEPAMEAELFSELGTNQELQSQLDDFLSIRESVQKEKNSFTVPEESTQAIFSAIGFNLPEPKAELVKLPKSSTAAKYVKFAAALLFVGVVVYLFVDNTDKGEKISSLQEQITKLSIDIGKSMNGVDDIFKAQESVKEPQNMSIPFISSIENSSIKVNRKATVIKNNTAGGNLVNTQEMDASEILVASEARKQGIVSNSESGISTIEPNITIPRNTIIENTNSFNTDFIPKLNVSSTQANKFTVYLRGITRGSFPGSDIPTQAEPVFSYMSAGLFRSFQPESVNEGIISDIKLGIEFGQEPFSQSFFQRKPGKDYSSITNQNPMLFWCSVAFRIDFKSPEFMFGIEPYSQVELGGTQLGPISKVQAGLQYNVMENIGINVGLDGSAMLFYLNPSWYVSEKLSLIYGMSIKF